MGEVSGPGSPSPSDESFIQGALGPFLNTSELPSRGKSTGVVNLFVSNVDVQTRDLTLRGPVAMVETVIDHESRIGSLNCRDGESKKEGDILSRPVLRV